MSYPISVIRVYVIHVMDRVPAIFVLHMVYVVDVDFEKLDAHASSNTQENVDEIIITIFVGS